jgi:hypothetical protein
MGQVMDGRKYKLEFDELIYRRKNNIFERPGDQGAGNYWKLIWYNFYYFKLK